MHQIDELHIETHQFDVLADWQRVVNLARQATVVFNMIDVGEYFDLAVQALCMNLDLLLIQGGNFCQQFNVESFPIGSPCVWCGILSNEMEIVEQILPSKVCNLESLEFLPRDRNPIAQSNVYLCLMTCEMMVARFVTHL